MQTLDTAKDDIAAQLRFESFKLGKPLPASMSLKQQHRHSRSHSRNASISSVASLPLTASKSMNSYDPSPLPTTNSMPVLSSKRNSHHRRRSSVSTRHESAEIMGFPDLPASSSEDSVTEKDSVRRRALWALEGKPDDASYSKVEIPELSTDENEKKAFDFSSKSFSSPSNSGFIPGINNLMSSKRDSFKPSSSKDQLHTLVEEEEEEDDWDAQKVQEPTPVSPSIDVKFPITPATPDSTFSSKYTASRPRPTSLALRPLSLSSEGLPTPSSTSISRPGLRSLSLVPHDEQPIADNSVTKRYSSTDVFPTPHTRARPMNLQISTAPSSVDETSRPLPNRRSSISYKSSSSTSAGLPTPEMTPTFAEHSHNHSSFGNSASSIGSNANDDEDLQSNASYSRHRPLSASEQHFLFKSHNALLFRIQDLEKALSVRRISMSSLPSSRPISSTFSVADSEDMSVSSEPSDEMLRLVADLKAERDELKRDVDGWRVRVGDLEKQIGLLGKRIEGERREAWVARSRVNLLEAEKNAFEKELGQAKEEMKTLKLEKADEIDRLKASIRDLEADKQRTAQENVRLSEECERWRLESERLSRVDQEAAATQTNQVSFDDEHAHSTWRRGLHYDSVDSLESSTDVDFGSFDSDNGFGYPLKAVVEEFEDELDIHGSQIPEEDVEEDYMLEEDNGLIGYEDEEEEDYTIQSSVSSSSFGSVREVSQPRSTAHLLMDLPTPVPSALSFESGINTPSTLTPGSRSTSSSPTWTFPRAQAVPDVDQSRNDVDKFFNCLEDSETDSTGSPVSPSIYTYEHNKGLFAKGLEAFNDDEVMPFTLPSDIIGAIVEEQTSPRSLPVVVEEEEGEDDDELTRVDDDDDMFSDISGIKITFTPAAEDDDDEYPSPHIEDSGDEIDDSQEEKSINITMEHGGIVDIPVARTEQTSSPSPKPVPVLDILEDEDEIEVPFNFGLPLRSSTPPHTIPISTPPRNNIRTSSPSPSPMPRSSSSLSSSTSSTNAKSSPTISPSRLPVRSSAFVTPPTKRGGAVASFIPQPVSSPSPIRKAPSVRGNPVVASFIRQPVRRPLLAVNAANSASSTSKIGHNNANGSAVQSSPNSINSSCTQSHSGPFETDGLNGFPILSRTVATPFQSTKPTNEPSSSSLPSLMTSPKLSLQTIASFIPRSWNSVPIPDQVKSSPSPRPYISRQKQLERLRLRLQREGRSSHHLSVHACQKCDGIVFSL
ncbi:hypothetical protein EV360DRAFT_39690 [Lentinula raphanica]|nr:hypothetical protein EV360DRAFT_39690 [Lentinula raphanica]